MVFAKSRSCFSVIDLAICFEAPFRLDFLISPRFAARAAPAAICCFFDLAGIYIASLAAMSAVVPLHRYDERTGVFRKIIEVPSVWTVRLIKPSKRVIFGKKHSSLRNRRILFQRDMKQA